MVFCRDGIFYQHLVPRFVREVSKQSRALSVCKAGDFFLGRIQDRLIWLEILETGFCQVKLYAKGLELQETSCHAIEASRVDELFEHAQHSTSCTNSFAWHALRVLDFIKVRTYSDARNVLTGVIDSPEARVLTKQLFCRVFLWVALRALADGPDEHRVTISTEGRRAFEEGSRATQGDAAPGEAAKTSSERDQDARARNRKTSGTSRAMSYEPPADWLLVGQRLSRSGRNVDVECQIFSEDWFSAVIEYLGNCDHLVKMRTLYYTYRSLSVSCYSSLLIPASGTMFRDIDLNAGAFYENFQGTRPQRDLFSECPDLRQIVIKSFRYTLKVVFDQILTGSDAITQGELLTSLEELHLEWFVGREDELGWENAILIEKPNIFSLGRDDVKVDDNACT